MQRTKPTSHNTKRQKESHFDSDHAMTTLATCVQYVHVNTRTHAGQDGPQLAAGQTPAAREKR